LLQNNNKIIKFLFKNQTITTNLGQITKKTTMSDQNNTEEIEQNNQKQNNNEEQNRHETVAQPIKMYELKSVSVSKDRGHVIRDFDQWDKTRLRFDPPKEYTNKAGVKDWNMKIQYDYGVNGKPDIRDLKIESPETYSPYGVSIVLDQQTKLPTDKLSITCYYDLNDPRHVKFLQTIIHDIYVEATNFVAANKNSIAILGGNFPKCVPDISPANSRSDFNYPVKYKKVQEILPPGVIPPENYEPKQTIVPGSKPYCYYEVRFDGKNKSNFHDDTIPPKEIPKEALLNGGIRHIPLVHFTSIYVGIHKKIKTFLHSSCVTDFMEPNSSGLGELLEERQQKGISSATALAPTINSILDMVRSNKLEKKEDKTPTDVKVDVSTQFTAAPPAPQSSQAYPQQTPPAYQPQNAYNYNNPQINYPANYPAAPNAPGYQSHGYSQSTYPPQHAGIQHAGLTHHT
jgi:hypothetical protein